jgi:hypothetical protein
MSAMSATEYRAAFVVIPIERLDPDFLSYARGWSV